MTVRQILGVVARRWYTTVVALALAAILTAMFLHDGGTYSTRAVVEFRWPGAARTELDNGFTNDSVISFADMVALRVNQGRAPERYSQDEAPLYGVGVRDAEVVGMSFSGNQWVTDHPVAAVTVQVIGRSQREVEVRQSALIDEVLRTADELQQEAGAPEADFVVPSIDPLSTTVQYIAPTRASTLAAFAAMTIAGLIAGVGAALVWDRAARHRRGAGVPVTRGRTT
ncbi:hypothetical protein [Microbacterium sp. NPDC058389]|uniref:hypothetical protein n=1 Tax=Microbacterium sp. NPDC058389 TaxID=3346475 RepID=UPI0036531D5C